MYKGYLGSEGRIAFLEEELRKNRAVNSGVPIVSLTQSGNIGVYGGNGAGSTYIPSIKLSKALEVANMLLENANRLQQLSEKIREDNRKLREYRY